MKGSRTIRSAALLRDRGLCCSCGRPADHTHHVVPLGRGGQDVLSNVVTLCSGCHGLVHGFQYGDHRAATRAGIARARAKGKQIGRKVSYTPAQIQLGQRLRAEGQSIAQVAEQLGLSKGATHRMLLAHS